MRRQIGSSELAQATVEASPRLRLSTQALPERERFEVFREIFGQHIYQTNIANRAEGKFEASIDLLKAGDIGVSRVSAPASAYARTRLHVSDADEALTLFVGLTHGLAIEQAGTLHEFRPGSGFLYHGSIPGRGEAISRFEAWGIKVPADRVKSG